MKRVLSGIQPSGKLTLGNYLGALKHFVTMQDEFESYFMIVDLHAITTPQDPAALREQIESVATLFVAAGLNPEKSSIFLQSHVSAHAELGWLMTTMSYMGELERMTQFKDKSAGKESIPTGLFVYPTLMAADILLYNADFVPVGDDQKQHLELTRDLAERFNHRYGQTFHTPEPLIQKFGARIMSLDDASTKMSKSNPNEGSYVAMLDEPGKIRKKIKRATTDSEMRVHYDKTNKPEISNLMSIYAHCAGLTLEQIEQEFEGKGYGDFKKALAERVVEVLEPIQQRYEKLRASGDIYDILKLGAQRAEETAQQKLQEAKEKMGFLLPR
ncbi:tryptophan--tRNA ligase [Marinicrinis sediminis]|uniref:Tryptophan--tRNA ligase n=1 Tax=Marinicrinis sediminis TaxID=1652465 RepID=A0ABW5R8H1_9BACL